MTVQRARDRSTTAVLLHPLGGDQKFWDPVASVLRRPVVALDLPGHGTSPIGPRTIEDAARWCEGIIDEIEGAVHLIGVSWGGLVAQCLATTMGQGRVAGVVLSNTVPRYPDELRAMWFTRAEAARENGIDCDLVAATVASWLTGPTDEDDPAAQYMRSTLGAVDPEGYARACEALGAADLREIVRAISAPVLALWSEYEHETFRHGAEWFERNLSRCSVAMLGGASHGVALQFPELFASVVGPFLDSADAIRGSRRESCHRGP